MAEPSYNIKDVYKTISTINSYFSETQLTSGPIVQRENGIIHKYCHYGNTSGRCHDYYQRASSGIIHLLKALNDKDGLEYDKLAEYAILWLGYKLAMKPQNNGIKLNNFYTNYIEKNKYYNNKINDNGLTYKAIIDTKKDFMNIKEISKFNYPFSILFYLYNVNNPNNLKCTNNSNYPEIFANKFKELNNDSNNIENSSYNKMLFTLSDDYDNLKKIYVNNKSCNFPSLPKIESKKSSGEIFVQTPTQNTVEKSRQISGETPEVTSSSSSISTTLIPGLSTFSVIPVFLGIAYKTIFKKKIKKSKEENET
ncbi:PIR protein CIR protein [Plasmodium vinckei petteri]|uniref:PIR protein CIR protein n=1 Tax=Plasmodium vinckei petteri TaxID=138298 RepID=A0A6V7TI98_PLAVN|nr:PIR protein CIR protein [Plasmodium vinckei petteri]